MASIRIVENSGKFSYVARINRKGFKPQSKTFTKKADAVAWGNLMEDSLNRGVLPVAVSGELIATVIDAFIIENKPNGIEKSRLARVRETLGDVAVKALQYNHLQRWVDAFASIEIPPSPRRKKPSPLFDVVARCYAPATIRRFFFSLKAVLEWHAKKMGYTLPASLFDIDKPEAWNPKDRRLQDGEEEIILDACRYAIVKNKQRKIVGKTERVHGEFYALLISLALETAARSQELIMAEWSEFKLKLRAWDIPASHTKTARGRSIPLSSKAIAIITQLETMRVKNNPRLFHAIPYSSYKNTLLRIWRNAGIRELGFGLHVMRHEAISRWVTLNTKLTLSQIMIMSGHESSRVFLRYVKMRPHEFAHLLD